jgi:chromosome segregation ATPase
MHVAHWLRVGRRHGPAMGAIMIARVIIGIFLTLIVILQVVVDWSFAKRMDLVDRQGQLISEQNASVCDDVAAVKKTAVTHSDLNQASVEWQKSETDLAKALGDAKAQAAAMQAQATAMQAQVAALAGAQEDARARLAAAEAALGRLGGAVDRVAASCAALDAAGKSAQAAAQQQLGDAVVDMKGSVARAVAGDADQVAQVQSAVDALRQDLAATRAELAALHGTGPAVATAPAPAAGAATVVAASPTGGH